MAEQEKKPKAQGAKKPKVRQAAEGDAPKGCTKARAASEVRAASDARTTTTSSARS